MADLAFIALTIAFYGTSILYLRACDAL